jgi:hypothetical protein
MNKEPKVLFETSHIKLLESDKGFQYLERKGRDSVAIFLLKRLEKNHWKVLVRWQPLCVNIDNTLFPCPITGTIIDNDKIKTVIEEVKEEAGYEVIESKIYFIEKYIVGTQTNEIVYMYAVNVTDKTPQKPKGDGSYFEKISQNEWVDFSELKDYSFSACKIGYYLLKDILHEKI